MTNTPQTYYIRHILKRQVPLMLRVYDQSLSKWFYTDVFFQLNVHANTIQETRRREPATFFFFRLLINEHIGSLRLSIWRHHRRPFSPHLSWPLWRMLLHYKKSYLEEHQCKWLSEVSTTHGKKYHSARRTKWLDTYTHVNSVKYFDRQCYEAD